MPKPKSLQALQREWYAKIAEGPDGFKDIEKGDQLKHWSCNAFNGLQNRTHPSTIPATMKYYDMAEQFLNDWSGLFMSEIEALIWAMHCEALGCRAIAAKLEEHGVKTNKDYVHWAIRDLKEIMMLVVQDE